MRFKIIRLLAVAFLSGFSSLIPAQTIDVLYTRASLAHAGADYSNAPTGWRVSYYDLDDAERLKEGLGEAMPTLTNDPATAKTAAQAWLRSDPGKLYIDNLKTAFEGYSKVINYGVTRLPAIVIDGKYLFYGVASIGVAINALPAQ